MKILDELTQNQLITDICINDQTAVYIDEGQGLKKYHPQHSYTQQELKSWVLKELSLANKSWDAKYPFIDLLLPIGFRLHAVFPPICRKGILVSLRRMPWSMAKPPTEHWKSQNGYEFIKDKILNKETVIISGATGAGKTTLLHALIDEIPETQRIIALEDTPELHPEHRQFLSLNSREKNPEGFGEISLREILKQSLRMRPDRIILGECRGAEVLELLQLLNTGHSGSLASIHANSAKDAIKRIELLCRLSSHSELSQKALRELLVSGIQWVIHLKTRDHKREIAEISQICGMEGDTILSRPVLK